MVQMRCLIVDDSEAFLASSTRLLEAQGIEVVAAARSGDEALELAKRLRPDVALVDIRLGQEDGFDVAERLPAATKVILISSTIDDDVWELLPASPAVGALDKGRLSAATIAAVGD
jgi:CheY-like chemotaxis protein